MAVKEPTHKSLEERAEKGHRLGVHRVLDASACLPQAAQKIDTSLPIYSSEILIKVNRLNIDAASFIQMEQETAGDERRISEIVMENTRAFGKQQNRVTHSGGMLLGTLIQKGSQYRGPVKALVGSEIATLVSLTLTPLKLDKILRVNRKSHQMDVEGYAVLFESGIAAEIPSDVAQAVAMAVLDVAGAPALTQAKCKSGDTVVVVGAGGKAGLLSCYAARKVIGKNGKIFAIEPKEAACRDIEKLQVCDEVLQLDAKDALAVCARVEELTHGKMADIVIQVTSTADTELSAILAAKPKGQVIFFSMATSFSKVTLGAEGVANEAQLIFGNGYYPGHAEFALSLIRESTALKEIFYNRYTT